ncbi:oxalate decarboxylase-like protein 2 [Elsinoe australis]|uniref:Oxalate decarboxylase-like protein 2 n=1 Tax=Elsinoe australis TaxID=40998 RepID=A0A4U7AUP6_9PEZI|nr:oxalate decarboxylase-like protein 2 [Elsinoe australis]
MKLIKLLPLATLLGSSVAAVIKRDEFAQGQPIDYASGKGAPITGGTNRALDLQNPNGLGQQSTDAGTVPNLKWSFSLSKTKIFPGGWTRTQVSQDLPQNHDIAGAQQHLKKGAIRELHWHRAAEWGFVYTGRVRVSAVDETGKYQVDDLGFGDIWYFPKGQAHTVQGLDDENEYLLAFDVANFDDPGVTFNVGDWVVHTPKDVLAKNFNVSTSVFDKVPATNPYILNSTISSRNVTDGPSGQLIGNSSYVYKTLQTAPEPAPGQGGRWWRIDSTNFPIAKTIAATYVELKPGGLRELHWHPNAEEWLYFHKGKGRASVFTGNVRSRTFDFEAGDTGVFPDNSGHYIENTSDTEDLVYIELYKSERVADVSLTQWLALTPADIVAAVLKIDISVVQQLKKEKQVLIA